MSALPPRSRPSALLVSQARWIEGTWAAMGALLLGTAGLAVASTAGLTTSAALAGGGALVGAGLGYWGGCIQTRRLRFQARSVELQVRNLMRSDAHSRPAGASGR